MCGSRLGGEIGNEIEGSPVNFAGSLELIENFHSIFTPLRTEQKRGGRKLLNVLT